MDFYAGILTKRGCGTVANDVSKKFNDLREINYPVILPDTPVIILLDGKNVTKNHEQFPLLSNEDNFTRNIFNIGKSIVDSMGFTSTVYAMTDEISFLFKKPHELIKYFNVGNGSEYILSLFFQTFLKEFWNIYPSVYMKACMFSLPEENMERYLQFRKELCYDNGVFYVAKEFLDSKEYYGCSTTYVEGLLKEKGLYHYLEDYPVLRDGLLHESYSKRDDAKGFSNVCKWVSDNAVSDETEDIIRYLMEVF